jgi:nucleoid-associated protein YgaU
VSLVGAQRIAGAALRQRFPRSARPPGQARAIAAAQARRGSPEFPEPPTGQPVARTQPVQVRGFRHGILLAIGATTSYPAMLVIQPFMDTPPSRNGSYLVFAVGILAVVSLIIGIVGMSKAIGLQKQVGDVQVVDMPQRLDTAEQLAKKASTDVASRVSRPELDRVLGQVSTAMDTLQATVTKAAADAKAAADKVAGMEAHGPRGGSAGPASGGSGGSAGPAPGTLLEDGTYVIKAGDTFQKIAPQFGTTAEEIVRANPGVDPRRLRIGQKVVIPKKP